MTERRYAINKSGVRVGVDLGRDMDEKTFDALVKSGDLTPELEKPAVKPVGKK